jgi:hypothetical protein
MGSVSAVRPRPSRAQRVNGLFNQPLLIDEPSRSKTHPYSGCGQSRRPGTEPISICAGQRWCGAPRRNRTGDTILTMNPGSSAVLPSVFAGHREPSRAKLCAQFAGTRDQAHGSDHTGLLRDAASHRARSPKLSSLIVRLAGSKRDPCRLLQRLGQPLALANSSSTWRGRARPGIVSRSWRRPPVRAGWSCCCTTARPTRLVDGLEAA